MKFKETIAQLKIDMEPMTFAQKADHIWSNFKEMILVFGGLFVTILIYVIILFTTPDTAFAGYFLNTNVTEQGDNCIRQEFLSTIGDTKKEKIDLAFGEYVENPTQLRVEENYMISTQLASMVEAKSLDFIVSDKVGMELCLAMGLYLDLNDFLTADEMETLAAEGRIIYAKMEDSEVSLPYVLDITDTAYAKEHLNATGKIYIGFVSNSTRPESCRAFWDYLTNY